MAAALTTASISAPVYPSVNSTNLLKSHDESSGFRFVCISSICRLASLSGRGTSIILSNLPGRNRASSIISGLFVAPIIVTPFRSSRPSISVSNCDTILSVT